MRTTEIYSYLAQIDLEKVVNAEQLTLEAVASTSVPVDFGVVPTVNGVPIGSGGTGGGLAAVRTPTAVYPLTGETSFPEGGTLQGSAYAAAYSVDARDYREFEVAADTDPDFSAPVFTTQVDNDSAAVDASVAEPNSYYWRCRDVSSVGDVSDWMTAQLFAVIAALINIANSTYDSNTFTVAETPTGVSGFVFNPDGTRLLISNRTTDTIYQYTLSSAFDLSTISYDGVSLSVVLQDGTPGGLIFNNDGSKLYMVGSLNDAVYQYSCPTPYSLVGASYDTVSLSVAAQSGTPSSLEFNSDGTILFVTGSAAIFQYNLTTPYDLSTASYSGNTFSYATEATDMRVSRFSADGTQLFALSRLAGEPIYQYSLSVAFDITTITYDSIVFNTDGQNGDAWDFVFNTAQDKFATLDQSTGSLYRYTTG